eukprot:m.26112 g.26112  ORF g.26112 m.26112 type:complete len:265 (-) comp11658_c0_seq1:1159-1953(-)
MVESVDLLLDPEIRLWVVVPIIVIAFCIGLCRHYASALLGSPDAPDKEKLIHSNALQRSATLRMHGNFLPREAFLKRKEFFNGKDGRTTALKLAHEGKQPANPMSDPSMMNTMMKKQLVNMVPMVIIGGLINWVFSGFVLIRVPFPLTIAFKPMLQRGIELSTLSASWVSSMSFYFTCVFGLSGLYMLVLGQNNNADSGAALQQQMTMAQGPPNLAQAFNGEWEALQMMQHNWKLNPKTKQDEGLDFQQDLATVERDLILSWRK